MSRRNAEPPDAQDEHVDQAAPLPGGPQWPSLRSTPPVGAVFDPSIGDAVPSSPVPPAAPSLDDVLARLVVRSPDRAPLPPRVQQALRQVDHVLKTHQNLPGWAAIDLFRFLDPAGAAQDIRRVSLMTPVRVLLLCVAVVLTILVGVEIAHSVAALALPSWATFVPQKFARVVFIASVTVTVLCLVGLATDWARRRGKREAEARGLEDDLRSLALSATLDIASRTSTAEGMARFLDVSQNLTDTLAAADRRINEIAHQREKEMAGLATFADGFRVGADHLLRNAEVVERMYAWCAELADTLARQQQQVEQALRGLQEELRLAHADTSRALAARVPLLDETVVKVSAAEKAMAQNLALLVDEITQLRRHARRDEKDFERALAAVVKAASELDAALKPLPATAQALDHLNSQMLHTAEQMTAAADAVRSTLIDALKDRPS